MRAARSSSRHPPPPPGQTPALEQVPLRQQAPPRAGIAPPGADTPQAGAPVGADPPCGQTHTCKDITFATSFAASNNITGSKWKKMPIMIERNNTQDLKLRKWIITED